MDFITKRALTLNAAKPKSLKVSEDPPRSAKSHHVKRHTESPQCVLCKGKHHVIVCKKFKEKSAVDRKAVAETHRLCFNCLGSHPIAKCQSTRMCITCLAITRCCTTRTSHQNPKRSAHCRWCAATTTTRLFCSQLREYPSLIVTATGTQLACSSIKSRKYL